MRGGRRTLRRVQCVFPNTEETERREKKAEEGATCISTKHGAVLAYDSLQARREKKAVECATCVSTMTEQH